MKYILLFISIILIDEAFGQPEANQEWNAFNQAVDVTAYRGGQFRFKGYVRTENGSKVSSARLWARVDKKKGMGFFYNMYDKPILDSLWKEYSIEGPIDLKAVKLFVGGLYFGNGKYYYDKFSLNVKSKDGDWKDMPIKNAGFEQDSYQLDWKSFWKVKGFESSLTNDAYEGSKALLIDASSRPSKSKFVKANGITIHYKEFGKGDTILLLHGNSESIESFRKQIPDFEKDFFVLAMDSRGQGYSTKDDKKMTYELMAEDVNSFLEALKIKHVNILGWSDGGNIGLILAMNHPDKVKRLAIMGANLYNDNTSVEEKINKILLKERVKLEADKSEDNKFRIEMIDLLLKEPKIDPEELKKIQCPTLVMAGAKDVIKEPHTKLIASKITKSKLVIFEKGTHYEPIEKPERFNKVTIAFFREQ
jgi:pimeloyl-ACP methyl ester carboxylesterase